MIIDHLLYRRYPDRRFFYWLLPASLIIVLYFVARVYALDSFVRFNQVKLDLATQLYTAVTFAGIYLRKILLPVDLKVFYHFSLPLEGTQIWAGLLFFSAGILLLIAVRRNRSALFGLLWFAILVLPPLFIAGVSPVLFAERYVYLASAGCFLTAVSFPLKKTTQILLISLCVVFAFTSFTRCTFWKDDRTLWAEAFSNSPESPIVNFNLATSYLKSVGCQQAIPFYERTVRLQPELAGAYYNLGNCYYRTGRPEEALKNLTKFLRYWKGDDATRQDALRKLNQLKRVKPAGQ